MDIVNNGLGIHAAIRKKSHRDIDRYRSTVWRQLNTCETEWFDAFLPEKLSKASVKRKNFQKAKSVKYPDILHNNRCNSGLFQFRLSVFSVFLLVSVTNRR
ncbi:MAG: hypothetical protein J6C40_04535 [Lentisphaeria bacterium]|nr:hypothetical protein [Lentisphaeria bacterium]